MAKNVINKVKINQAIRSKEVRVIDKEGKQIGIIPLSKALQMAKEANLDLVEVAPSMVPPVCRIMDYGKYKYKKEKSAKKKQKILSTKEIKLRPVIEEHDYGFKLEHIKKFLSIGNKVKVVVMFKGREITYLDKGRNLLKKIEEELKDISNVEQEIKTEGSNITIVFGSKIRR